MTLKKIHQSDLIQMGNAVLIEPDGTLIMSTEDFKDLTENLHKYLRINTIRKDVKPDEQRSSNR